MVLSLLNQIEQEEEKQRVAEEKLKEIQAKRFTLIKKLKKDDKKRARLRLQRDEENKFTQIQYEELKQLRVERDRRNEKVRELKSKRDKKVAYLKSVDNEKLKQKLHYEGLRLHKKMITHAKESQKFHEALKLKLEKAQECRQKANETHAKVIKLTNSIREMRRELKELTKIKDELLQELEKQKQ